MDSLVTTAGIRCGRAWLRMVAHLRETNPVSAIEARLHTGEPVRGIPQAAAAFAGAQHAAYVHGGQRTARWLAEQTATAVRKKLLAFDAVEPTAVAWAQRNRLDKVREITDDQRDLITELLTAGARSGANPRQVAGAIYGSIGLTDYQARLVANYRRQLEEGGAAALASIDRALTSGGADRTVVAAVRDSRAIPPERIDAMVDAYRDNWLRYRAETIARTEGLRVAHQASDELFTQSVVAGDIDPEQVERKWVHTNRRKDARVDHKQMNGQLRGFGEPFQSGSGVLLMFPCDPQAPIAETANCTCLVTMRIRRLGFVRAA